jgi:hypothetical protein
MCPEGSLKFLPGDNMSSGLHGTKIIPPNAGSTTKLLGGKVSFTRVRTRYSKKGELRFNSMKPGIGIQRFFSFTEKWGLGTEEILIACTWGLRSSRPPQDYWQCWFCWACTSRFRSSVCRAITSARFGGGGSGCWEPLA